MMNLTICDEPADAATCSGVSPHLLRFHISTSMFRALLSAFLNPSRLPSLAASKVLRFADDFIARAALAARSARMSFNSLRAFSDRKPLAKLRSSMMISPSGDSQSVGATVVGIGDEVGAELGPICPPPSHAQHCSSAVKSASS